MTLRIFFVAGDVGGARALYPVIQHAVAHGHAVHMLWHGHLATMPVIDGAQIHHLDKARDTSEQAAGLIALTRPDVLAFTSSVHDDTALRFAAAAQEARLPVAHLLDNWTSYRQRLMLGDRLVAPDLYAVMDDVARQGAAAEGIPPTSIWITGTPALSELPHDQRPLPDGSLLRLVFVSEPVTLDQGDDPTAPGYRGYTETTALAVLAETLADRADAVRLDLLPHPREDRAHLAQVWARLRGPLAGSVIEPADRQRALLEAHGIVGMASILLYEMWLRGWPVASLQPGLRLPQLRMLAGKNGLVFADERATAPSRLRSWRDAISSYRPPAEAAMERSQHRHAAETFLAALGEIASRHRPGTNP